MKAIHYLGIVALVLIFSCNAKPKEEIRQNDIIKKSGEDINLEGFLNKKNVSHLGNYFVLTESADSTFQLTWGNNKMQRTWQKEVPIGAVERLQLVWESSRYMILKYGVGSGAWENIALPLNEKDTVQEFDNALCFDSVNNLIGVQQFGDTILYVQNLNTNEKQFIIEKAHRCEASSGLSCIDTIGIKNKQLYLKWVTPNNFTNEKKTGYAKRIPLHI